MKHIVWKAYWNYEKEEKWLNEMSAKGMALSDYSWCRYVFTDTPKNEYTYRIELLEYVPSHCESQAYLKFLEENGIEHVASYWRWIYLRKKTSEGPFDIYSDIQSKITHYNRVSALFGALGGLNLFAFILNLKNGIDAYLKNDDSFLSFISPLVMLNGFIAICVFWMVLGFIRKIRKLKKEMLLHE